MNLLPNWFSQIKNFVFSVSMPNHEQPRVALFRKDGVGVEVYYDTQETGDKTVF